MAELIAPIVRTLPIRLVIWAGELLAAGAVVGLVIAMSMPAYIGPSEEGIRRAEGGGVRRDHRPPDRGNQPPRQRPDRFDRPPGLSR